MNVFGLVLFIIFMLISAVLIGLLIKRVRGIAHSTFKVNYKKEIQIIVYNVMGITIAFTIGIALIYLWNMITPKWYELIIALVCSSLFISSISTFYVSFRLHYYVKDLNKTLDKALYRMLIISIPVMIISLWYAFNGFSEYITYPIANGINIPNGVSTPEKSFTNGLTISFYALCILSGAVFVYFLCDHKMYQQYGKHGTLESTFLVAFPAGIIGARIWYVIGNWKADGFDERFASGEWWSIFAVWEGGLTILGGAIMGIVFGVLWYIWRNKHYSIWVAVDMIVPTILLAQAIGRIGNFFNCEVHGMPVEMSYFNWLPQIILKNGTYSSASPHLENGTFYLPLFLIEGLINIGGYFIIAELFGKKFRKYTELGDLGFGYVLVYGFVRMFLEPLRDASYNMGTNGYWSWAFSCSFIVFGAVAILINHLVRFIIRTKKNNLRKGEGKVALYSFISTLAAAIILLIVSIILMASNKSDFTSLSYSGFNIGMMIMFVGLGTLFISGCSIIRFFEAKKSNVEIIHA